MASVKREETTAGPRWRVRYRRPDGRETSKRFDRRGKADDFAARIEHDRRVGSYVDPAGPRTLFAEVAARWAETAAHKDSTARARDSDLRLHVLPALGRYRIGDIGPLELEAFLHALEAKLAPSTIERVWAWVTRVFAVAVRTGLVARNPTVGLAPPSAPRPLLVPLEGDMVEAVMGELPAHYRGAAVLAADAGLRLGEVFGLTAVRVGFLARQRSIHVERQLISVTGSESYLRLPKWDKTRAVPVGDSVTEALAEHMARFPRASAPDRTSGSPAELVFATEIGTPVRRNVFGVSWSRAVRRAGLPVGTRFHDLRHYYAAVLVDAGLPEREIGARLGHSSAEVTARYGHLFAAAEDRTRRAVDASVAARRASR